MKRGFAQDYIERLAPCGIPILCETPPADTVDVMERLWALKQQYGLKIQIAEQYFLQPLYAAWLSVIERGFIGETQSINISALHGYHAVSIIRKALGVGFENCSIYGKAFPMRFVNTRSRQGFVFDGSVGEDNRERLTLEFENGKYAFYDFAGVQYRSTIHARQLNIVGTRGEIDDMNIYYLSGKNEGIRTGLNRIDEGVYNNSEWSNYGIMLNGEYVYRNPLYGARLNDDELAVATCLYLMRDYVDSGKEFYSLADGLQDAYFSMIMKEAIKTPNVPIKTDSRAWSLS